MTLHLCMLRNKFKRFLRNLIETFCKLFKARLHEIYLFDFIVRYGGTVLLGAVVGAFFHSIMIKVLGFVMEYNRQLKTYFQSNNALCSQFYK